MAKLRARSGVPALTAEEMTEVDRIMVEELSVTLPQMMENAGRNLADLAKELFHPRTATVLAGPGGNGGGGLVVARHLANRGVEVVVVPSPPPDQMAPVTTRQLEIARRMSIPVLEEPRDADVIIDALIGYSLRGNPRGRAAALIEWANAAAGPVLALDTPSGLDVTSGEARTPCVEARATMTLALPKVGLLTAPEVGELFLADISVPPFVYARLGHSVTSTLFADGPIVRIER